MEKDKLSYELEVINILRLYAKQFEEQGLSIDTRYLDYCGNQCPKCKGAMKVYNKTVKRVGSISAFMLLEQNKAVLYPLCKPCAKKLSNYNTKEDKKVEEFIFSRFPELIRPILSEDDKREKIKKEYLLLDKMNVWKRNPEK